MTEGEQRREAVGLRKTERLAGWLIIIVGGFLSLALVTVVLMFQIQNRNLTEEIRVAQVQNDELLLLLDHRSRVLECIIVGVLEATGDDFDARRLVRECREEAT